MQTFALIAAFLGVAASAMADSMGVEGIENCPNKCDKVFQRNQYAIADQPNTDTFEYRACITGCDRCNAEQSQAIQEDTCFDYCKKVDWKSAKIRKGLIEPDKACIIGCIINTCQQVCMGGTTDDSVTPANQQYWWGLGGKGCSIKSGGGYVQNPQYGNPDSPGGQGANDAIKQCCANAFNLCQYKGDKGSTNYANVVVVAKRSCKQFVPSQNPTAICTYWQTAANCGTPGMNPV